MNLVHSQSSEIGALYDAKGRGWHSQRRSGLATLPSVGAIPQSPHSISVD